MSAAICGNLRQGPGCRGTHAGYPLNPNLMETRGNEHHLFIAQRSFITARKDKAMKVAMIALVATSVLSSTYAFAHTPRHEPLVRSYPMYMDAAPHVVLHPNDGIRMEIRMVRPR